MAQRAIININGDLLPFDESLDKIQTQAIGGGSVTWVPEADTRCVALKVTENGSKSASDEGVYGWDYVAVSIPGSSVTGIDPATGQETTVTVNPETGDIVKTVVPVEIRVTTPPTKTDYTEGETIDYSGIVVHAYSSTGQDMGAVPFNELVFPVTTAQGGDEWSDGHGLNAMMLYYTPHWSITEWLQIYPGRIDEEQVYVNGDAVGSTTYEGSSFPATYGSHSEPGTMLATRYNGENYFASISGSRELNLFALFEGYTTQSGQRKLTGWQGVGGSSTTAGVGRFTKGSWSEELTNLPQSTVNPTTVDPTNLHATQSLPVQWPRTGDGAILETSFTINVTGGAA